VAEDSPQIADLYFSYGRALLENAISQNSVLGKEGESGKEEEGGLSSRAINTPCSFLIARLPAPSTTAGGNGPILSFSGDVEDEDEDDPAVDLFQQAAKAVDEADHAGGGDEDEDEEDDNAEPEDDFNAAWEVLDLARAIYDKQKDEDEEIKLKLADTYITLGDVSLETGLCLSVEVPSLS
jgi:HAT1-interacting factor 1